jgi:hypothetical protein
MAGYQYRGRGNAGRGEPILEELTAEGQALLNAAHDEPGESPVWNTCEWSRAHGTDPKTWSRLRLSKPTKISSRLVHAVLDCLEPGRTLVL